jgi:hypothetical protein
MRADLRTNYPDLHVFVVNERVQVRGCFPVVDSGRVLDRFNVEIDLPSDYPRRVPGVREVGGRIPRHIDCHVQSDGRACLFFPEERWRVWPEGSTFLEFLDGPVRGFFIWQSLRSLGADCPFGERAHGELGALEYYTETLGSDDPQFIVGCLDRLSQPGFKGFRGHWPCPCGSGVRIRNCHPGLLADMHKKIPPDSAARFLSALPENKGD